MSGSFGHLCTSRNAQVPLRYTSQPFRRKPAPSRSLKATWFCLSNRFSYNKLNSEYAEKIRSKPQFIDRTRQTAQRAGEQANKKRQQVLLSFVCRCVAVALLLVCLSTTQANYDRSAGDKLRRKKKDGIFLSSFSFGLVLSEKFSAQTSRIPEGQYPLRS